MRSLLVLTILVFVHADLGPVWAQSDCGASRFLPPSGPSTAHTNYGAAIDASHSTFVIGASEMVAGGVLSGSAWVFEKAQHGWGPGAQLLPPDGGDFPRFGHSVAIEGETCLVGARSALVGETLKPGAVYSFERAAGKWVYRTKLVAPDMHYDGVSYAGFSFGASIDIDSGVLAVGATADNSGNGIDTGAVYLYEKIGGDWSFLQKLHPPDGGELDLFGSKVSLSGERLYVSSPWHDDPAPTCGAIYVYVRQAARWVLEAKLQADDPQPGEAIGAVSAFGDDRVAAGAATYDTAGWPYLDTGRVLVFERSNGRWACSASLVPSPIEPGAMYFGVSVVLRDGELLAGAHFAQAGSVSSVGACYRFVESPSGWVQESTLAPARPAPLQGFGDSIARSGSHVFVGAPGDSSAGHKAGAVFAIDLDAPDCNETGWPDACEILAGHSADADADGVPDECTTPVGEPFCLGDGSSAPCPCGNEAATGQESGCLHSGGAGATLTATGVPSIADDSVVLRGANLPSAFALYFQGTSPMPPQSFGDGLLCVSGSHRRLGLTYAFDGTSTWPTGGSQPVSVVGQVQPGEAYYQVWYRNSADFCTPATFNLSNALRITWAP